MPEPLISPWSNTFDALVGQATKSLMICSPYVGRGPCERIASILRSKNAHNIPVLLLTDLSSDNMLSGGMDVGAVAGLCDALPRAEIRFLPKLHAKIYIADEKLAVVTSANLTDSGLCRNFEYGVYMNERELVKRVTTDLTQYASLGSQVHVAQLREFERVVSELKGLKLQAERKIGAKLRREFENRLREADEDILRVRANSMSQHAAFADTVLYLLKRGPRDTKEIYAGVREIHPDLCDDSVKLVISGEAWSQVKWHHRIRHAQLFLKRAGRIRLDQGKWHFVR